MRSNLFKTFAILIAGIMIYGCAKESYVNINDRVQHDDFFYSVTDLVKSPIMSDGTETIKPKGVFYIVHLKIDNQSKSVTHKWDNDIAYVEDGTGKKYENDLQAQKLYYKANSLAYKDEYSVDAGSSAKTVFIFDVPSGVNDACLRFKGSFLMGDLLDGGKFTKTRVKLF